VTIRLLTGDESVELNFSWNFLGKLFYLTVEPTTVRTINSRRIRLAGHLAQSRREMDTGF
jgi:hypothetical protein